LYVLLVSVEPLRIYWYNDCLVRFATQRYDLSDLENTYSHLTNSSINKNSTSYSIDKEGIRAGCKWSLQSFMREHPDHPLTSPLLWARIKASVTLTLLSIAHAIPDNGGCFELLGYDVIIDEGLKPWLLEVNTSPALAVECAADKQVKEPLISDLLDLVALQRPQPKQPAASSGAPGNGGKRRVPACATAAPSASVGSGSAAARARHAVRAEVQQLPATIGGYELIFPFNDVTAALADGVGGNEAQIVAEIKATLQCAAAAASAGDAPVRDAKEAPGRLVKEAAERPAREAVSRVPSRQFASGDSKLPWVPTAASRRSAAGHVHSAAAKGPPFR